VARQQEIENKIYRKLLQDMKDAGIEVLDFRKLGKADEVTAKKFFAEIRPLLSPRVVDAGHPFPFVTNKEVCVAASLGSKGDKNDKNEEFRLGLVSLFRLPPWRVWETEGRQKVALTSELVRHYASQVFKKQEVRETVLFQVTRNADVFIEDDLRSFDADFRASMEKMLRKRKRQQPVRLQISGKPSPKLLGMLVKALKVPESNVFVRSLPFELGFGSGIRKEPGMKYDDRRPHRNVKLQKGEFFSYLEKKDMLLSYPFQSMNPFVELLYEAADDPSVVSISITLYRLSASSKVAAALAYAADRGKSVLALLELRARFDEQSNIDYSEVLEDAGCQVIYGLPDMKVHSKLCLITRMKDDKVSYITQVGTGNYNETTSEQYTDITVITSRQEVGRDAAQVFESLALGQAPSETEELWVAPNSYRTRVLEMIERERLKGSAGHIAIKVNSMNDLGIMRALIAASRAGVKIEMFVRGICCLLPGIPGFTDNITVRSVVGRYLEHSRIFSFGDGEDLRIFVGSGDLLNRNTQRRVEVFVECTTEELRTDVLYILEMLRQDSERCWTMNSDGTYTRIPVVPGTASQDRLYRYFGERIVEKLPEELPEEKTGWLHRLRDFFRGAK
jgi:polyphosphate kinase